MNNSTDTVSATRTCPPAPVRANVGCGRDILDGWVNVDLFPIDPRVVAGDIRKLPFEPGSLAALRAIDVLEHVPRAATLTTLKHWFELLAPGGTLELRSPDVREQARLLLANVWTPEVFSHMVFAAQDSPGNFHQAGFTQDLIAKLVRAAGFTNIAVRSEFEEVPRAGNANFRLTARKP